jgi:hypothetical protein
MKTILIGLFLCLVAVTSASIGQSAATPRGAQPSPQPTERLGRLFLTPQQRQDLDRKRQLNIKEAVVANEGSFTVDGQVSRSAGGTTTWINGVPEHHSRKPVDTTRAPVQTGESEPSVSLKIGQTVDKASGEVNDGLRGGRVQIERRSQSGASR